ncbi:MAG: hypothetical protein IKE92_04685 [Clostridiales bacterium]|nr:hypothetical protein [Clostridiales bacterium]
MNVVYSLTRNVYDWLLPSVRSLAKYNPSARIFILAEDDELPFDLPINAEVINISGQKYFPNIAKHRSEAFGGYINHLKIWYSDLLPVNKVIHLDIDTIICDKLDGLWKTDVSGKWFAAVPESQTWYRPFGDKYYNMGVALFNLQQIRKDKKQQEMTDFLLTANQPYADQNAWNKFGKPAILDLRYNESKVTGYTDNPAIVHFCAVPDWWTNKKMFRREYLEEYR